MPFRAKLRKTFSKKSPPSSTAASGDTTPDKFHRRSDVEYYEVHEIPKSKYRGRVDPVHQKKLHAFSFGDAFGRRASSIVSGAFSPRGTHAQSRRASWMSRTKSNASEHSQRRKSIAAAAVTGQEPAKEDEVDDTDVANATLSRPVTSGGNEKSEPNQDTPDTLKAESGSLEVKNDSPFSSADLERAMTAITLKPREDSIHLEDEAPATH